MVADLRTQASRVTKPFHKHPHICVHPNRIKRAEKGEIEVLLNKIYMQA